MNGWLWLVVIVMALTMYGLGCLSARAHFIHRREGGERMIGNNRANAFLAIFFTVVALVIAVDGVYFQIHIKNKLDNQVDCNTRLLDAERTISLERQRLDSLAAEYEIAHFQYAEIFTAQALVKPDDPRYLHFQEVSQKLIDGRLHMAQVYSDNPLPKC